MRKVLNFALICGAVVLGIVFVTMNPAAQSQAAVVDTPVAEPIYSYDAVSTAITRDEQLAQADAIFIGKVTNITPARFNQDSGAYWSDEQGSASLPYHQIEVAVIRPLFDQMKLEKTVAITVLGGSSAGTDPAAQIQIDPASEHTLRVGDETIFFVRQTDLAWRSNPPGQAATRPIVQFLGSPRYGYLRKQADGRFRSEDPAELPLDVSSIVQRLQQRRSP